MTTGAMTRLKYVARLVPGGTPATDDMRLWAEADGGTPWVSIADITKSQVIHATTGSLTDEGLASKRLPVGEPGTILFAMYASVGALVSWLSVPRGTKRFWGSLYLPLRLNQGF
jgi:type I restriction enzyme, S subunit